MFFTGKKSNSDDLFEVPKLLKQYFKPLSSMHEFYLCGIIEESDNYVDWFHTMRNAGEHDVIKIYINSYGGSLFTAIQFLRAMNESNATIIASVEGACMSAATLVFLAADHYEVTPHSMFMFHNYSGGAMGKGGEMIDQLLHERKWSETLLNDVYDNFLSQEEIKSMLDNKDIWMDGEEVAKRINIKVAQEQAMLEKLQKEAAKQTKKPAAKKPAARQPVTKKTAVKQPVVKKAPKTSK